MRRLGDEEGWRGEMRGKEGRGGVRKERGEDYGMKKGRGGD